MLNNFAFASQSIASALVVLRRSAPGLFADPYRPERHYMRGPGPKWREKHPVADEPLAPSDARDFAPA